VAVVWCGFLTNDNYTIGLIGLVVGPILEFQGSALAVLTSGENKLPMIPCHLYSYSYAAIFYLLLQAYFFVMNCLQIFLRHVTNTIRLIVHPEEKSLADDSSLLVPCLSELT
jgi:glycerol-3-phosphate acyltransferase PlsY